MLSKYLDIFELDLFDVNEAEASVIVVAVKELALCEICSDSELLPSDPVNM